MENALDVVIKLSTNSTIFYILRKSTAIKTEY